MPNPNKITYSDEKLNEFISLIKRDIGDSSRMYSTLETKVYDVSLREILENTGSFETLLDRLQKMTHIVSQKHDKYMNILDPYEFNPSGIMKNFEFLVKELEEIYFQYTRLEHILEGLISLIRKK